MTSDHRRPSQERIQLKLDALRRDLGMGKIPDGFDRLYQDLTEEEAIGQADEGEKEVMLAILISDAMDGVDITKRHPVFFRSLLSDAELRSAFLEGLEMLEGAESEPLPFPASRDLSFLDSARPSSSDIVAVEPGGWKMRWQRTAEELEALFSFLSLQPGAVFRSGSGFLEDETVTLLRGTVTSRQIDLDVTLDAMRLAAKPDELQLALWIVPANEDTVDDAPASPAWEFSLLARVKWGSYEEEIEIEGPARYTLPPRPISDVVDETGNWSGDLTVSLQTQQ